METCKPSLYNQSIILCMKPCFYYKKLYHIKNKVFLCKISDFQINLFTNTDIISIWMNNPILSYLMLIPYRMLRVNHCSRAPHTLSTPCQLVILLVHLLSFILARCPAHLHFYCSTTCTIYHTLVFVLIYDDLFKSLWVTPNIAYLTLSYHTLNMCYLNITKFFNKDIRMYLFRIWRIRINYWEFFCSSEILSLQFDCK